MHVSYNERPPSTALARYVQSFWALHVEGDGSPQIVTPDGSAELVIHCGTAAIEHVGGTERKQPCIALIAKPDAAVHLAPNVAIDVIGARLQPAALGVLFGAPASALEGTVDLEQLLSQRDRDAVARVRNTESQIERMALLEAWLFTRLRASLSNDLLARRGLHLLDANHSIDDTADSLAVTPRQLERVFAQFVGLSPKRYLRVRRFRRALTMLEHQRSIADTVFACGYFDHAHLNRDFRHYAARAPTHYAAGADIDRALMSDFSKP